MKTSALLFVLLFTASTCAAEQVLHLTGGKLKPGERIVAFSLRTRCLRITGVKSIPADWDLTIKPSDDGGTSIAIGSCHHGASSLTSLDELIAFGFVFEKECKDTKIDGEISATVEFENAERRKISGEVIFDGNLQQILPTK